MTRSSLRRSLLLSLAYAFASASISLFDASSLVAQAVSSVHTPDVQPLPLTTLDRVDVPAAWLGCDDAGRLRFQLAAAGKQVPAGGAGPETLVAPQDLVAWGAPPEITRGICIVLVDGTLLAVETVACDSENLQAKIFSVDRTLPLTQVRGIVFQSSGSQAKRERMFDAVLASRTGDRDRVVMLNGDETTGTVKSIDYQGATLETSLGPAVIDTTKVSYLVFNPALAGKVAEDRMRIFVGLKSGSVIVSDSIRSASAGRVRLQPTALADAATPWDVLQSEVTYLQTFGGKAIYLSSLEPAGYRHVPFLSRSWAYRADRSVTDGSLRAGGRRYLTGLGMHSASRITYALDGTPTRFAASVAIDDETDGRGSVTFRVFVDGEEKYRSPTVRGGDRPLPIEVPIAGGKQLSLVVDFADFADEQDHANWLDARLLP